MSRASHQMNETFSFQHKQNLQPKTINCTKFYYEDPPRNKEGFQCSLDKIWERENGFLILLLLLFFVVCYRTYSNKRNREKKTLVKKNQLEIVPTPTYSCQDNCSAVYIPEKLDNNKIKKLEKSESSRRQSFSLDFMKFESWLPEMPTNEKSSRLASINNYEIIVDSRLGWDNQAQLYNGTEKTSIESNSSNI